MARVHYTSGADLAVRIVLALVSLALVFAMAAALTPLIAASFETLSKRDQSAAALALSASVLIFTIAVLPGDTDEHMATMSSWIYARTSLGVSLSWFEAKAVAGLFAYHSGHDDWYPLIELRRLSPPLRKQAIFEIATQTGRILDPLARAGPRKWKTAAVWVGLAAWIAFVAFAAFGGGHADIQQFTLFGMLPAAVYGGVYFSVIAKASVPIAPHTTGSRQEHPRRVLGQHAGKVISICDGRYGHYIDDGEFKANVPKGMRIEDVTLEVAVGLIAARKARVRSKRRPATDF